MAAEVLFTLRSEGNAGALGDGCGQGGCAGPWGGPVPCPLAACAGDWGLAPSQCREVSGPLKAAQCPARGAVAMLPL